MQRNRHRPYGLWEFFVVKMCGRFTLGCCYTAASFPSAISPVFHANMNCWQTENSIHSRDEMVRACANEEQSFSGFVFFSWFLFTSSRSNRANDKRKWYSLLHKCELPVAFVRAEMDCLDVVSSRQSIRIYEHFACFRYLGGKNDIPLAEVMVTMTEGNISTIYTWCFLWTSMQSNSAPHTSLSLSFAFLFPPASQSIHQIVPSYYRRVNSGIAIGRGGVGWQ